MPNETEDPQLDDWFDYITNELKGEEVLPSVEVNRTQSGDAMLHAKVQTLYSPAPRTYYVKAIAWATDADGLTSRAVKNLSVELVMNEKSAMRKSIELGGMIATGILRKSSNRPIPARACARSENPRMEVTTEVVP